MSFFNRLFKIGQSEAHSALDKFENPIKLTEQGIRDLKKDLNQSLTSLAEVKAIAIRHAREIEQNKNLATDYEKKAVLLLQKSKNGSLAKEEAERLAIEVLSKKEEFSNKVVSITKEKETHDRMVSKLEANISKLKSNISTYENQLTTLKARYKTALATKKLNKQLSQVDSSSTIALLEKMKDKVNEQESLAEAYGDVAEIDKSVENEIDAALKGSGDIKAQNSLDALKAKMGM